jgi:hypothetical protein
MNVFRLRKALTFDHKSSRNLTLSDSCISYTKSNPLSTIKQIKGVQNLYNILCAYCDSREVFESEESKALFPREIYLKIEL